MKHKYIIALWYSSIEVANIAQELLPSERQRYEAQIVAL